MTLPLNPKAVDEIMGNPNKLDPAIRNLLATGATTGRAQSQYPNLTALNRAQGRGLPRDDVYALIDGERRYQDSLPTSRTDGQPRSVGDYLTMLRYYLAKADEAWTQNPGDEQALDVIRKIGGIAVHCMEDHGAPPRGC